MNLTPTFTALAIVCLSLSPVASAANFISNPGFESGSTGWILFIPSESAAAAPVFTVVKTEAQSGTSAAKLSSTIPSRYALSPLAPQMFVKPSQRVRVSAWYKGEPGAVIKSNMPGPTIRVKLNSAPNQESFVYCSAAGTSKGNEFLHKTKSDKPVETKWTKLEAVFEVDPEVNVLSFNFFAWGIEGALLVDDVVFEKVDINTPLTPLLTKQ